MEDLGADVLSADDSSVRETVHSLLTGMSKGKDYESDESMEEGDDYVIIMASDDNDEDGMMSVEIERVNVQDTPSPHPVRLDKAGLLTTTPISPFKPGK